MLPAISIPEVFPLGLQEERPLGAKLVPLPEFEFCDLSPRVSMGPSANSMASSSSEIDGINDHFSFHLPGGSKSTSAAPQYDQSLLIKQQQSADAEMQKHQQQYWPQLTYAIPTQGQLPLVNLDEDLEDALGFFYPQSPLDFGDVSVPHLSGLHSPCKDGSGTVTDKQSSPLMLPSEREGANGIGCGAGQKTKKPRRPVGRPRSQPIAPLSAAAPSAAALASGGQPQKSGRGPKPKYVYATNDEALDARKERNRKAALESYYRKRQKTDALNQEIRKLEAENALLESLVGKIEQGDVVELEEATEEGLNAWLAQNA